MSLDRKKLSEHLGSILSRNANDVRYVKSESSSLPNSHQVGITTGVLRGLGRQFPYLLLSSGRLREPGKLLEANPSQDPQDDSSTVCWNITTLPETE